MPDKLGRWKQLLHTLEDSLVTILYNTLSSNIIVSTDYEILSTFTIQHPHCTNICKNDTTILILTNSLC